MTYRVTVYVQNKSPFAATVTADNEWQARTKAMLKYPHALRGEVVNYQVILDTP
jgi:hypothetical protein